MTMGRGRLLLVVFDLDGTLIRGNTCCELIAARIGRLDRMREFERCTTQQEIAAARMEMADWYSTYSEEELTEGLLAATAAPGLRTGIARLQDAGVSVAIASITWSFAVRWFARRLGVEFYLGTELRPDRSIVHVWADDKALWLSDLARQLGLQREQTAAVGDSMSDLPMLRTAGRAIYVGQDAIDCPDALHLPAGSIDAVSASLLSATIATRSR